jgi:multiple sugar transport system ATP-binding protein
LVCAGDQHIGETPHVSWLKSSEHFFDGQTGKRTNEN